MLDFQVILLAVSLSVDALAIGISYGFRKITVPTASKIIITLISFAVTAASTALGAALLLVVPLRIAKFLGPAMLATLGAFTIFKSLKNTQNSATRISRKNDNFFQITKKIIDDPESVDFNKSSKIDLPESVYLGIALSIDSLCSGITSAFSGISSALLPAFVAFFQLALLCIGLVLAKKFSSLIMLDEKYFSILSGAILLILATIRLFAYA